MLNCYRCIREVEPIETVQKIGDNRYQIRATCPKCGQWIKWLPYKESKLVQKALGEYYDRQSKT
jgi:hypothetical protein